MPRSTSKARAVLSFRLMYAITCATGRTGTIVGRLLMEAGRRIRVVVRKDSAAQAWRARGAEARVADYADVEALTDALRGASVAYVIPPPLPVTEAGHHAYRVDRTRSLASALRAARVREVVSLSSFAAQHPEGTGMIKSCHTCEQILDEESGAIVTHLRPSFFLENWTSQIDSVKHGVLPTFLGPIDRRFTMVGTADIGAVAARLMLEPTGKRRIVQLTGRDDYSVKDIALAFGRLLDRNVEPLVLPIEAMADELVKRGFSSDTATNYQELFSGMMTGHVALDDSRSIERGTLGLAYTLGVMLAGGPAIQHALPRPTPMRPRHYPTD